MVAFHGRFSWSLSWSLHFNFHQDARSYFVFHTRIYTLRQWWICKSLWGWCVCGNFADVCKMALATIHVLDPRVFQLYAKMQTSLLQGRNIMQPCTIKFDLNSVWLHSK